MNNTALPALEQTVGFASKRHLLLASNLANMDTPDYQTRDISVDDFQSTLKAAIENSQAPTSRYSSPSETRQAGYAQVRDVSQQILFHDGSDVSLEEQVTEMSKNQSMHNTAIALMRSQFLTLKAAITESANV
ncbi:MAG: flagellar basal body rod protein FlgB [Pirellulaceae bacterium]|nr:flagellar basal body rod protein FlgB [Pirellulaceae bacterium]